MTHEHQGNILEKLVPGDHLVTEEAGEKRVDLRNVSSCEELVIWAFAATEGRTISLPRVLTSVAKVVRQLLKSQYDQRKYETILIRASLAKLKRHANLLFEEAGNILKDNYKGLDFWEEYLKFAVQVDNGDYDFLEGKQLAVLNPTFKVLKMEEEPFTLDFDEKEPIHTLKNQEVDEEELIERIKSLPIQEHEDNRDSIEKQLAREKIMGNMRDITDLEFKELTSF